MTSLTTVAGDASLEQVVEVVNRDGGVIIENFLSADQLKGLQDDLLPHLSARSTGREFIAGEKTRRLGALFAHSRYSADIASHPLFFGTAETFLSLPVKGWMGEINFEMSPDIRIGVTQAIQIGPGQGAQPLHRDDIVFLWRHPSFGREARVQVIVALCDFTVDNGATMVIPGSHKWDDERAPLVSEAVPAVMKAGSALMYLGSTYHGGGQNVTENEFRSAIALALDLGTCRQEENMYLALSSDVVSSYPENIQRLLGWTAGSNAMGWVEIDGQMADPNILVNKENTTVKPTTLNEYR